MCASRDIDTGYFMSPKEMRCEDDDLEHTASIMCLISRRYKQLNLLNVPPIAPPSPRGRYISASATRPPTGLRAQQRSPWRSPRTAPAQSDSHTWAHPAPPQYTQQSSRGLYSHC